MVFRRRGSKNKKPFQPRRAHKINEEIKHPEVRLTDEKGEQLGLMSSQEALSLAHEKEVDLVEISATAKPPVCKIIDYGKMLYSMKKKEQKAKQVNKTKEQKGVRITFKMDVGDIERQQNMAKKFLEEGHGVKIQMRLRGRERAHMSLAIEKMNNFINPLSEISKVEQPAKGSGSQVIATLSPEKKSS